jgi:hypothetical protein
MARASTQAPRTGSASRSTGARLRLGLGSARRHDRVAGRRNRTPAEVTGRG